MTLAHALVYVIDDDMSTRKAIGRLLESEDYSVELFTGAREFLARAHTGPLCVILDLNMPGLNGLELQEALTGKGARTRSFSLRAVPAYRLVCRR
jgi:FixJ family two-component response regulator